MKIAPAACVALIVSVSVAASQEVPPTRTVSESEVRKVEIPWPMRMGVRSMQVRMRIPVIDQVVLVPDAATWLDEVSRWTLRGRWPVLIEDADFAPVFVRAFAPARVVRRSAAPSLPVDADARRVALRRAVARAWTVPGSDVQPETPAQAFASVNFEPMGMVVTSVDDPAWPAAVALAAGHGQALVYLDGDAGNQDATLTPDQLAELSARIEDAAKGIGLPYSALGDAIDAVTIARTVAVKAVVPDAAQWRAPQGAPVKRGEPVAVTDALCRNADGSRWAIAGWIFGDERRSAYAAMSSLFLSPRSVWEVDTYPATGEWTKYSFAEATPELQQAGFAVEPFSQMQASPTAWGNMLMGGFTPDLMLMNTKGNMDFFEMYPSGLCYPEDVPILQRPLALHLIHSWSLTSPGARSTVGGTWLDRGVYAYAGSVFEPYLVAFVPPAIMAPRIANYVPFLVAARWGEGPNDACWRVTTIGDPLMVTIPPSQPLPPRVAPPALDASRGEQDIRVSARDALVAAKGSGSATDLARALADLVLAGDDAIAVQLWGLAVQQGEASSKACARAALGPLFRARRSAEFVDAYRLNAQPTLTEQDMLWQLWTPQFGGCRDGALLAWFAGQARSERPFVDLGRLAPEIARVSGGEAARAAIAPWIDRTPDGPARTKLREIYGALR